MIWVINTCYLFVLREAKGTHRWCASSLQRLKDIQNCWPKLENAWCFTVKACIVQVQNTKSTKLVSFVQPVWLLKTTNRQFGDHESNRYKKELDSWVDFFDFFWWTPYRVHCIHKDFVNWLQYLNVTHVICSNSPVMNLNS